ncbi:MAG TPA: enoyl-CoA hydratase/isomerase family protein [Solirubrobacterales bacterium]|nr:enoyl-CoA hydratase/isomerase family protein [Solirubrobacterales bacterium]
MSNGTVTPPDFNTLVITIEGDIGTLTLNRPDSFNAMSPELIEELAVAFGWLADQAPLRALIVTGSGAAFCSGGDINWFKNGLTDPDVDIVAGVRAGAERLHQAIVDLQRISYPVIAAINGPAAGAGFSLALACDIRIASDKAFLACAYGRIGASPDGGMTYFLPRVVGPSRAVELLLNDPNLTAEAALADKLVSEVVPADELMDRAKAKAAKLGAMSPYYVKMTKRLVHSSLDRTLADHLQYERHGIAESMATEDLQGAVTAFLAGEKAEFKGQ